MLGHLPQCSPEYRGYQFLMHYLGCPHTAIYPVEDRECCTAHASDHEQGIHCQVAVGDKASMVELLHMAKNVLEHVDLARWVCFVLSRPNSKIPSLKPRLT